MLNRIKSELLNVGLKFISIDKKIVHLFLETSPSNVSEIVILPAVKMVMKKIINKLQNKRVYGRVYNGLLNGIRVSVIRSLVGCPNCAITVECLKRCNAKVIIRVDFCGGLENLNNHIEIGDIIIPKLSYCGDGTSPQYFLKFPAYLNELESIQHPISRFQIVQTGSQTIFISKPNEPIKNLILNEGKSIFQNRVKEVALWTTDALFTETHDFVKSLESINVEAIDMESSILFLLGCIYNLKTASILSVSDLPESEKYDMFKSNEIHPKTEQGIDNAIKLLLQCLPKIKSVLN